MIWFKIWIDKTLADDKLNLLSLEARGLRELLQCFIAKSPVQNYLYRTETEPYTDNELATLCRLELQKWLQLKQTLLKYGGFKEDSKKSIGIPKWAEHQSDYYRQKGYRTSDRSGYKTVTDRSTEVRSTEVRSTEKNNNTAVASLPPFVDPTTWADYLQMRKAKRCPTTPRAIQLIFEKLKKLLELGNDPNAVLDQSIVRGWTGIFPLPEPEKMSTSNYNPSLTEKKSLTTYIPLGEHPDANDPKPLEHFKIKPKPLPLPPSAKKILSLIEIKTLPIPPDSQSKKVAELKKIEELQKKGY